MFLELKKTRSLHFRTQVALYEMYFHNVSSDLVAGLAQLAWPYAYKKIVLRDKAVLVNTPTID